MQSRKIIQVEDKVPLGLLIPLSIQHMFAMFGASVLVPFLFCALTALTVLRRCPRSNGTICIAVCSVTAAGLLMIHLAAPHLYETSALGGWILAFLVFGVFFVRELISLFQQRKEGIIGGVAA